MKKVFLKFPRIHKKTPMLESSFNKVKETPTQVFSCEDYEIFKNTYFEEHLQAAASEFFYNILIESVC